MTTYLTSLTSSAMLALVAAGTVACSGMDWSTPTPEINPAASKYPTAPSAAAAGSSEPGIVGPSDATPATNRDLEQEPGALTRRPGRGGR